MATAQSLPAYIRAAGEVNARFSRRGDATYASQTAEAGGFRLRFPNSADGCEGTLINTGGGLAGGDRLRTTMMLDADTTALMSTQAAEKVYRSDGAPTIVDTRLALADGARLCWLPQETILFSGADFQRTLAVEMAPSAAILVCEAVVFGRIAMGETIRSGRMHDRWRVRRAGMLAYADDMRLDGDVAATLAHAAVARGARALATVLLVAADAQIHLDAARAILQDAAGCDGGASAWNGLLVIRLLAREPHALRRTVGDLLCCLRGRPLPRSWQC